MGWIQKYELYDYRYRLVASKWQLASVNPVGGQDYFILLN